MKISVIKENKEKNKVVVNQDAKVEIDEKKTDLEYRADFISRGESERERNNLAVIFDEILDKGNDPKDIAFFLTDKPGYFYDKKRIYWQYPNTDKYKEIGYLLLEYMGVILLSIDLYYSIAIGLQLDRISEGIFVVKSILSTELISLNFNKNISPSPKVCPRQKCVLDSCDSVQLTRFIG